MNKLYPFAFALASMLAVPASAMAWDSTKTFDVVIITADREVDVGEMRFRADTADFGLDSDLGFDDDDADVCTFFVTWTNDAELPLRTNLMVDQIATVSFADCIENAEESINTVLFLSDEGNGNNGFDRHNQRREVQALVLGQTEGDELAGVIQFEDDNALFSIRLD
jgi:hypothetical protein